MPDVSNTPRPSQLWKQLDPERKLQAADAFWRDDNAGAEQAEAVALIAQRIKFRLKSVIGMPVDKKARQLISLPGISEPVAARLLVAYHLVHQRPMMEQFLDALGIAHDEGLISDENLTAPPPERLAAAAQTIGTGFPADAVSLYLSTLFWQDPDTWSGVVELPQAKALQPSKA
jgi:hypothetical protein